MNTKKDELYSGSFDSEIMVWDVLRCHIRHTLRGHQGSVNSLSYCSRLNFLASGSSDSTVRVWDLDEYILVNTLAFGSGAVQAVQYSN